MQFNRLIKIMEKLREFKQITHLKFQMFIKKKIIKKKEITLFHTQKPMILNIEHLLNRNTKEDVVENFPTRISTMKEIQRKGQRKDQRSPMKESQRNIRKEIQRSPMKESQRRKVR